MNEIKPEDRPKWYDFKHWTFKQYVIFFLIICLVRLLASCVFEITGAGTSW